MGRFRRLEHGLELVGVSRQRPGSTLPQSSGPTATGPLSIAGDYPGCPSCGADEFVRCGQCGLLACWDTSWLEFACPSCGNHGPVSGVIESFTQAATG